MYAYDFTVFLYFEYFGRCGSIVMKLNDQYKEVKISLLI